MVRPSLCTHARAPASGRGNEASTLTHTPSFLTPQAVSKRVQNAKSNKFHANIHQRGAVVTAVSEGREDLGAGARPRVVGARARTLRGARDAEKRTAPPPRPAMRPRDSVCEHARCR